MESKHRICKKCSGIIDLIYEFHKTCLKNNRILSSYKNALRENKLKKQCHLYVNLDESKQFKEDTEASIEVKVEPQESPLKNDDTFSDTDLVANSQSNESAERKKEVDNNYEVCDEESETSWLDSEMKIKIEEVDLKKEWLDEINNTAEEEASKLNVKDFENNSDQSNKKTANEDEENQESVEAVLLEVAEGRLHEGQVHFESSGENSSMSHREKQVHEEKEIFDCAECGKTLTYKLGLDSPRLSHSKDHTHSGRKSHQCVLWGTLFSTKEYLNIHTFVHTGEKPYKCDSCGESFKTEVHLRRHMFIPTDEKSYKCDSCEKSFKMKEDLKRHMFVHTGEKPHKFDCCGKSFKKKGNLMLIHTDEKASKCDSCGKSFKVKVNLRRHVFIHTDEKPCQCHSCGKSFKEKAGLKRHMFIHMGEKPHKCDSCGKSFKVKQHLRRHMFIHTGEKPYKCDSCGKSFKMKQTLKKHLLMHTSEKSYKCDICGKLFKMKEYLIHRHE